MNTTFNEATDLSVLLGDGSTPPSITGVLNVLREGTAHVGLVHLTKDQSTDLYNFIVKLTQEYNATHHPPDAHTP